MGPCNLLRYIVCAITALELNAASGSDLSENFSTNPAPFLVNLTSQINTSVTNSSFPSPSYPLRKRSFGRLISSCPDSNLIFQWSQCQWKLDNRLLDDRAYIVSCQDDENPNGEYSKFFYGTCVAPESCHHVFSEWGAQCISAENVMEQFEPEPPHQKIEITKSVGDLGTEPGGTVEATLAASGESDQRVNARHMQIAAQSVHEMFGAMSYTTIGLNACDDCGSVVLGPLPKGTQAINLNVDLGAASSIAGLYMLSS